MHMQVFHFNFFDMPYWKEGYRFGSSFSKTQIHPKQSILNYMFHSYCKHANISNVHLQNKKNEISFEIKYTITTLHTNVFKFFEWKKDSKEKICFFVCWKENIQEETLHEYLKVDETNEVIKSTFLF